MQSRPTSSGGKIYILPCEDFADVAVSDGHVLGRYFHGVPELIRQSGRDARKTLASFGIDIHSFLEPKRQIPCAQAQPLIEECGVLLDDPFFGLNLAEAQDPSAYGYLAPLCRAAPDLRTALQAFVAYVPLVISPEGMFKFQETADTLEVLWDCDSDLRQNTQGNLHGVAILIKLIRLIIGEDFRPQRINLPGCVRNEHVDELARRFGCEISFPSDHYGSLMFSAAYASRPVRDGNTFVFHALERPLAAIRQQIEGDISARVKTFIRLNIDAPECHVDACATALGSSVRTLQKHLARMGTSFSGMLEEEKCEMAKAALQRSTISLDELAFQLGYAEQSTFGRAFRRWTGLTPGEFRRSMQRGRPSVADPPHAGGGAERAHLAAG